MLLRFVPWLVLALVVPACSSPIVGTDGGSDAPSVDSGTDAGGSIDGGVDAREIVDGGADAPAADAADAPAGSALHFGSPTTARVLVGDTTGLYTNEFTWEAWVAFEAPAVGDPPQLVFIAEDAGFRYVYLRIRSGSLECVIGDGAGDETIASTPAAALGTSLHHVVCERSLMRLSLWVDGVMVAGPLAPAFGMPSSALGIGGDFRDAPFFNSFQGVIDEVRFSSGERYGMTFTPERHPTADATTLALWHFDEGSGGMTVDSAGTHSGVVEVASWIREP